MERCANRDERKCRREWCSVRRRGKCERGRACKVVCERQWQQRERGENPCVCSATCGRHAERVKRERK